jgi:hypothetical protein
MKRRLLLMVSAFLAVATTYSQTNTLQLEDSNYITRQRWRDTCFGLLDKSVSLIPTGYLLDYSLAPFNDSLFNSAISNNIDTITESGQFFSLHNIFTLSAVNPNATLGSTDSLFINAYRYQRNTSTFPILLMPGEPSSVKILRKPSIFQCTWHLLRFHCKK